MRRFYFCILHSSFFLQEKGKKWFWKGCKPSFVCVPQAGRRESFVSAVNTRNLFRFHETRSGQLLGFLFGLAPDGVCQAATLTRRAVRSYRTFSPSPAIALASDNGLSVFCGTFRQKALKLFACVYLHRGDWSYAASRPMEFGLSSFACANAILRPSKTNTIITKPPDFSSG